MPRPTVTFDTIQPLSHDSGGRAGRRVKVTFSNFPLELEQKYFNKIYIENNITNIKTPGYELEYTEDIDPNGYKQLIPINTVQNLFKDNIITLNIDFDPYKRNYFMFQMLALNILKRVSNYKKEKVPNTNEYDPVEYQDDDPDYLETMHDIKIDKIYVDLCDDVGNPHTLLSLVYENCFLQSLDELNLDAHDDTPNFGATILFETFYIDYDRMEILSKLEKV